MSFSLPERTLLVQRSFRVNVAVHEMLIQLLPVVLTRCVNACYPVNKQRTFTWLYAAFRTPARSVLCAV